VGLTDAGRLFIDNIGPSLQGVHQALEVVRSRSETPSGVLRINTPPFAARTLLSRVVLEFLHRYPQMQVDIVTDGRLIDIVAEGFDMGVRVASLIPEDMIALSSANLSAMPWWLLRSIFRTISGLKPLQICSIIPASGCVCPMVPSIAGILRSKEKRCRSMSAGS
jgi:DNA-binding transcriptional LysR family regulator